MSREADSVEHFTVHHCTVL